jgi:sec-independent protein translocase protein TatC
MENKKEKEMSFLEHIEVFRGHLIKSVISILVFGIIVFIFRDIVFDKIILAPKSENFITNRLFCELGKLINTDLLCSTTNFQIININLAGQLSTHIKVSLMFGFVLAFPYVFYQVWSFIKPALKKSEIKKSRGAVFSASILFSLGALFGYYIITPLSVQFLGTYSVSDIVLNKINLDSYIQTFSSVIISTAVVFELPVLIYFLSKIGLITPSFLKKYRKHAFVLILIVAAIITPPDIFSQIVVSIPLVLLYELGIFISKRVLRNKEKLDLKNYQI